MRRNLVSLVLMAVAAQGAESQYKLAETWAQLPGGTKWGAATGVDVDAQDRL